jgi:hypothetical protein
VNGRQQRKIQRYVEQLQPLLGLNDWVIEVEVERPSNEGWIAQCSDIAGRRRAYLRFGDIFFEDWYSNRERTATIIHELLHAVQAQERNAVQNVALHDAIGAKAFEIFRASYHQANEYAVDTLACALAPLFPQFEL